MSDRPVFVYAATYADRLDADADYDTLLDLHSAKLVGTYDVALVTKDQDGKVHVIKHEKPTQHGAWTGIAVGAVVGVLFPPSVLGAAVVGGVGGGLIGHLRGGMSRGDAKELGDLLDEGQAALVVVGESRVAEQLDKALTRAEKSIEKEVDADSKEFQKELEEAERGRGNKLAMPLAISVAGVSLLAILYFLLFVFLGIATIRKGHWIMFIVGIFVPLFWIIGGLMPPVQER